MKFIEMGYEFRKIEKKWQEYWKENQTFRAENKSSKPKYYVLDMFPYPSGAGLHVGHPLGYIASDIYSRFKRHQGFNVLHPMGYDAYGLPAEQYAIQTGTHPAVLKDQVTTPGGCTIAGLGTMEDGKIRSVLARTVEETARVAGKLG